MIYDGPRRQGRFIKNGSKVMSKVSLVDFSFKEINDAKVVTLDNAQRTILHSTYHDEVEMKECVQLPDRFNEDLSTRDHRRPVIFPTDFTKEWERDKRLRKDRVSHQDEDDFDYDQESVRLRQDQETAAMLRAADEEHVVNGTKEGTNTSAKTKAEIRTPASVNFVEAAPEAPVAPVAAPAGGVKPAPVKQWESMDVVGKAINGLLLPEDEEPGSPAQSVVDAANQPEAKRADAFIPTATKQAASSTPVDPEAEASEDYKARLEALKVQEQKLLEVLEEAKAHGYRDGFRMGEEKAELQGRQHAGLLFGKVTELIHEFSGLKHEVLNNVQENFYELCQAMAESLVKREFSINPETFVAVLRRAIAEAVEPGKFKIKVNPETFDRIAALGSNDIMDTLVRDKEMAVGDFKIESQLSVVDVNVTKMISELLRQADLNLFQEDKAG